MENNTGFSKLLNVKVPAPKRSNFNLSKPWYSTLSPGFLNVVDVLECLPGDDINLSITSRIKSNPAIAPLLGSFKVRFFKFFAPMRNYVPPMNRNDLRTDFKNNFELPVFSISQKTDQEEFLQIVTPGSLLEQIGVPIGFNSRLGSSSGIRINAVPILAYYDIFRNYFLNPQEDTFPLESFDVTSGRNITMRVPIEDLDASFKYWTEHAYANNASPTLNNYFFNRPVGEALPNTLLAEMQLEALGEGSYGLPSVEDYNRLMSFSTHSGLCRTCYGNDVFMSRLATSYVDYVNSEVRVDTSSGSFNINQLRMANKLAKFVDRSVLSGTRYGDWLKAHFGQQNMSHLNVPYFIGAEDYELTFDDVVSQSETGNGENGYLGSVGGRLSEYLPAADDDKFYVKEHGYYMVLMTLTPKVSYFQGLPKYLQKTQFSDIYVPELDAVGWQPILRKDMLASKMAVFGESLYDWDNRADDILGYSPAWIEYMTRQGSIHGQFATSQRYWTLAREFGYRNANGVWEEDYTTYVDPSAYNYAFAGGVEDYVDNFYMLARLNCYAKRNISKQILPSL